MRGDSGTHYRVDGGGLATPLAEPPPTCARGHRRRARRQLRRGRGRIDEYAALGVDGFVLSGWPHREQAERVGRRYCRW
ncbi:hypothetical protein JNW91_21355 [Micromonospora sp. STR1_7]|uniref:Uncharacterized protein n=1 Tax=Micromonospora parastrephiae TaxID=2806101 RepID=A0ABS1XY37_9ACTN|nr:hypothetical protein [Micromonospora parastrephiae]MBM0234167.1 hypothetical protein [Micromonospora parastrephiae]